MTCRASFSHALRVSALTAVITLGVLGIALASRPVVGVTIAFDSDATAAAASRKKVFGEVASKGLLVGAEHLQFPALGHLSADGKSWRWVPVDYPTQFH